jgi:tRNA threonylcarbamoyl adenosine modification protein YeaZ
MKNEHLTSHVSQFTVLAFDTALDKMYVVLKKNGSVLSSEVVETTESRYHSAELLPTIQAVLKANNVAPQEINLIAVNIGPGSFTGIRACVTVARVMAQALGCKSAGVSSLEILSKLNTTGKPTLVALDARKDCAYLWRDGEIKGAVPLANINTDGYFVITDEKLQPLLGGISYQQNDYPLGEILAQIAEDRSCNWQELKPLYIQPPALHTKDNI